MNIIFLSKELITRRQKIYVPILKTTDFLPKVFFYVDTISLRVIFSWESLSERLELFHEKLLTLDVLL